MTLMSPRLKDWLEKELNFFRIHLLVFTFVPLIVSGILYGVNGEFHIPYIDCLFLSYSAFTVTGLSTVNLSTMTGFQQAILFVLMICGDVTVVSWIMVLVRKHYFRVHCEAVAREARKRSRSLNLKRRLRLSHLFPSSITNRLSGDNDVPHLHVHQATHDDAYLRAEDGIGGALAGGLIGLGLALPAESRRSLAESEHHDELTRVASPERLSADIHHDDDGHGVMADVHSFTSSPRSGLMQLTTSPEVRFADLASPTAKSHRSIRYRNGRAITRKTTVIVPPRIEENPDELGNRPKDQNLGGFPGPFQIASSLLKRYAPSLYDYVHRALTVSPGRAVTSDAKSKNTMKWLPQNLSGLMVGRNGDFNTEELTDDQLEELGGLEYRALRALSYIVMIYFVGTQLISFILIAPWLSTTSEYDDVFEGQPRLVPKAWFAAFQVVGAYTGGGMSLVDAGMVPFQRAYLMVFAMIFVILCGNHGMPIFLRLVIWLCTKFVEDESTADQALHFLLDHPRRCFLYLFPSHVTWFLALALVTFTAIEWSLFAILNSGLDVVESLGAGTEAVAGLFQSFAVRASGFSIVSIASLAPSFQFMCIVMMYIAIYPVALSIRSTNVYEERSLGVFEAGPEDEDEEPNLPEDGHKSRRERIGKYVGWHLRRQVAYDIWWLVCGIWVVCIVERTRIMDETNSPWLNVFTIVFEMVSAFGGIGLTLGIPNQNFALSGAFSPVSKLVICIIMLRGRHRGLPVAIDRAILLPDDLIPNKDTSGTNGDTAQPDSDLSNIIVEQGPLPDAPSATEPSMSDEKFSRDLEKGGMHS